MVLLALIAAAAHAGIPLVHEGGDAEALTAEASERTGLPADQFTAVDVGVLRQKPPQGLGEIAVRRCARQPSQNSAVRAELVRAEAALGVDDLMATTDHLDLAVAELGCLSEVVEASVAARVFLLRGALIAESGRPDEARGEIRTSLAFDAKINWPSGYPVSGQALVAEEAGNPTRHPVAAVPDPGLGPWIDGAEVQDSAELSEGLHLFQYGGPKGIRSAWLVVGGAGSIVVPEKFQAPVLAPFAKADTRADLERLLAGSIDAFEAAYVAHAGGLWLVVAEGAGASTTELVAPPPPPPPPEPEPTKKRDKKKK